ncbi:MAG: hypothetical protein RLZZ628_4476 [Bacteroidota bacterium]|jgi:hypothetical protein
MKKLLIHNQKVVFSYSESAQVWSGTLSISGMNIPIEIEMEDYHPSKIDWDATTHFLSELSKQALFTTNWTKSQVLLKHFIQTVPHGIETPEQIQLYRFELEAILYKGTNRSRISEKDNAHKYEFLWKLYHAKYPACYDPYGNYVVQAEDSLIIGIRRDQV